MIPFEQTLQQALAQTTVRAWRLHLETPEVEATVPLLRGVWGAALHEQAPDLYRTIFESESGDIPRYVLRPAPAHVQPAPALEMILFGPAMPEVEDRLWAAWELALARGLGPQRRTARLVEVRPLAWDGTALAPARRQPGFALSGLPWPGDPASPCWLRFQAPLRLLRHGRLLTQPTLADLTVAALRRLHGLSPGVPGAGRESSDEALRLAWAVPSGVWEGRPLDLVRYSARQRSEIELRGVAGELYLGSGPGPLASLLAAACWLHLGKGTVMGLGQLEICLATS
jgi:hypothetical protein